MSFFVNYRKKLAVGLGLPETATWEECLFQAERLGADARFQRDCDHEFMYFGTFTDQWEECFICGLVRNL